MFLLFCFFQLFLCTCNPISQICGCSGLANILLKGWKICLMESAFNTKLFCLFVHSEHCYHPNHFNRCKQAVRNTVYLQIKCNDQSFHFFLFSFLLFWYGLLISKLVQKKLKIICAKILVVKHTLWYNFKIVYFFPLRSWKMITNREFWLD